MAPPDFAENTDMAEDLDYKTGLDFWENFFFKNPRLIGGLIRYIHKGLSMHTRSPWATTLTWVNHCKLIRSFNHHSLSACQVSRQLLIQFLRYLAYKVKMLKFTKGHKSKIKMLNYNTPPLSCCGQITLSNIDEICPWAIQNQISIISMHVPSLVKIPWLLLKLSPGNKKMGVSQADNSIKIWWNLSISNPNPDLHLTFTHYHPETKIWACLGQITPSKFDKICPLAIPNQISTISMHIIIPNLAKIHWCLLKLSSWNFFFFFWFGFYGPFKNISLISSRSFIEGGRKPENPEKNHLTIRKQNLAFPHMTRARLEPQRWET